MVKIGKIPKHSDAEYIEPRYDHPEFQKAFAELNDLLLANYGDSPQLEYMDLMMYGFWGEGHTSELPNPLPDYVTAERTFVELTAEQLDTWKRTPLAVNTQPDISHVGNRRILDMALRGGAWLRSDSIRLEEPIQIDELANRPPWLACIMEDGDLRQYDVTRLAVDSAGVNSMENRMLHALDLRANYWSLWTESDNLKTYNEHYPRGFERLRTSIGYRLRPAWVWQRKRNGTSELIVCVANRGVAGVPGILWLHVKNPDGGWELRGALDPGHPYGGSLRECSFLLPQGFTGRVQISAEIELRPGVIKPITWACEQELNSDGSIAVDVKSFDDSAWRKGI
jgi:hypothetical protein